MKYIVQANILLLDILALLSPNSSKTTLRSWVKEGRVKIDGKLVSQTNLCLFPGQCVVVGAKRKFIDQDIEILFEDRDITVINKPNRLLSVASNFEKEDTAHSILKKYYQGSIYVVHRLDQDTSGVMVFARHEQASENLKSLFEDHNIDRCYLGIVEGHPQPRSGTWSSYLYEDSAYYVHSTQEPNQGRIAITHFMTERTSQKYSLMHFRLETGRKNQIRVHCQAAGYPIAGDKKYGAHTNPLKRLCLHAQMLAFEHPITHQTLHFESPIPQDFEKLFPQ